MTIDFRWLTEVGITCNFLGAVFIAYGLMISKDQAIKLSVSRVSGNYEENLKLPQVKDRLKQSWNAKMGVAFLIIGLLLQLVGSWPR